MKFQATPEALLDEIGTAFGLAIGDVLEEAQRIAPERTGKYRRSLRLAPVSVEGQRLVSAIGSPLASARPKEKGAYITARKAPWLAIPFGDGTIRKVKSVRLPASPVVGPAGARFPEFLTRRLREQQR